MLHHNIYDRPIHPPPAEIMFMVMCHVHVPTNGEFVWQIGGKIRRKCSEWVKSWILQQLKVLSLSFFLSLFALWSAYFISQSERFSHRRVSADSTCWWWLSNASGSGHTTLTLTWPWLEPLTATPMPSGRPLNLCVRVLYHRSPFNTLWLSVTSKKWELDFGHWHNFTYQSWIWCQKLQQIYFPPAQSCHCNPLIFFLSFPCISVLHALFPFPIQAISRNNYLMQLFIPEINPKHTL